MAQAEQDELVLQGNDKLFSNSAAFIQQVTAVKNDDNRKFGVDICVSEEERVQQAYE